MKRLIYFALSFVFGSVSAFGIKLPETPLSGPINQKSLELYQRSTAVTSLLLANQRRSALLVTVETDDDFLQAIAQENNNIVILATPDDPVLRLAPPQAQVYVADKPEDVPAMSQGIGKRWYESLKDRLQALKARAQNPKRAFAFALMSASGTAGPIFFMTHSYASALGAGLVMLTSATISGMFLSTLLEKAERNGIRLADLVGSLLGRPLSDSARSRMVNLGTVGSIYGMNILPATASMYMGGQINSVVGLGWAAVLAWLQSSELVDSYAHRFLRGEPLQNFGIGRLTLFTAIEAATIAGSHEAAWFGGGIITVSALINILHEDIAKPVGSGFERARSLKARLMSSASPRAEISKQELQKITDFLDRESPTFNQAINNHCDKNLRSNGDAA